jgi:hypothetical protein
MRAILTQEANLLNFREMMDYRKIVLLKVSKETLGSKGADMLGSLLLWKLYEAAMSRADIAPELRQPFSLYIDEFQHISTESFAEILSEARKYWLSLTIAHQHLDQLPATVQQALFGNVANFVSFRVGAQDACRVANELAQGFDSSDVVNLPLREFYIKMCIDGETQAAFSGRTLNVEHLPLHKRCVDDILKLSKARYCARRKEDERRGVGRMPDLATHARTSLPVEVSASMN